MKSIYLLLLLILNVNFSFSKNLRTLAECQDFTFLATEENVKIIGRTYNHEDETWIVHGGAAVEFYAVGNTVELFLVGDDSVYEQPDFRPRYAIYVDDKMVIDTTMSNLEFTVQFKISNDENAKSKIKVMMLSEAQNGGIGIKAIKINSCQDNRKIWPVEKKRYSIEFIGDSITNAYGVDAPDQSHPFKTTTENFSKSYAYLASEILDADYSSVSYSGHGIVSGYSGGDKWADGLVPLYYEKISKNTKYPGDWDFENHKYDVVLINLGTNDANYVNADRETRKDEFVQEYVNFLKTVRAKNPSAFILCTLGTLNPKDMYPLVEEAVKLFGDERTSVFQSPTQDMNDGLGADWHPSKITHQKLSKLVAEKIAEVLK